MASAARKPAASTDVIVDRAALASALKLVKDTVRTGSVPILEAVLIEADGPDFLAITATNTERQMRVAVPAQADDFASLCVSHDRLDVAVAGLMGDEVRLVASDGFLTLHARNGGRRKLQTLPASDFPVMAAGDLPHRFEVEGSVLDAALAFTTPAMAPPSEATVAPTLVGVFVGVRDKALTFVGLDSKRLHEHRIDASLFLDAPKPDLPDTIWPDRFATSVRQVLAALGGAIAHVECSGSLVRLAAGRVQLLSKLIDGTYPDFARVVTKTVASTSTNLKAHGAELARALGAVDALAERSKQYGRVVALRLSADGCDVRCTGHSEGEEPIDAVEWDGAEELRIGVTASQVAAAVTGFGEVQINVAFGGPETPLMITAPAQAHRRAIIFPVRI